MALTPTTLRLLAAAIAGLSVLLVGCSLVLGVLSLTNDAPRPEGSDTVATALPFLLAVLAFAAVGVLVVRQQPRNAMGWLLSLNGLLLGVLDVTSVAIGYAIEVDEEASSGVVMLLALTNWTWVPAVGLLAIFTVLLFPDGHLPSARWSWLPWTGAVTMALLSLGIVISPNAFDNTLLAGYDNPFAVELPGWVVAAEGILFALFAGCMLASAVAAVGRYRRSRGVERLQMKWLACAGAFFAGVFGLIAFAGFVPSIENNAALGAVVELALPIAVLAVPLAIGVAILKHGLYEIDVVINKAVVLGVLAFFITSVYVAIVVGVGRLVGGGDRPDLVLSIAATAVVAVAFEPVRERAQRLANRLVYGVRATPYEVLAEFADRVGGSYDAAELLPMMARTVGLGVGAASAEVWLATSSGLVREATWGSTVSSSPRSVDGLSGLVGDRVVEVRHQGELLGALSVVKPAGEAFNPTEERLLDDVASQAGLVLRNVRLIEDLRSSRQRLVSSADEERRRLERNLHDGAQQSLVSVALMINTARAGLGRAQETTLGPALEQAADQLKQAIAELRELARGIHPAILTERGLGPAISSLAERSPVPVTVDYRVEQRPPAAVEASVYFLVAEALTNIAKYAHASQASVGVHHDGPVLSVTVSDDGIGGADETKGSGLRGLADRVAVVDGTLTIESPPGRGTRLTCRVPVPVLSGVAAPATSLAGSLR